MKIAPESVPTRSPGATWNRLGEEVVILDADGRMLRGLNPTGARIWESVDGSASVTTIAATIATEFDIDLGRALHDVALFLSALADRALIGFDSAAAPGGAP